MPHTTPVLNKDQQNLASYQTQLVEHIRQQFEQSRQQWEQNLETRIQQNRDVIYKDKRNTPKIPKKLVKRKSSHSQPGQGDLNVNIELRDSDEYMGGAKKFIVRVDISSFSPDEPVVVRTLENAIVVCGEHCGTDRLAGSTSLVKMVDLPTNVDPSMLRTSTTRDRILVIEAPVLSCR